MNTYPFGTYDTVNKIFLFNPDFDKPIEEEYYEVLAGECVEVKFSNAFNQSIDNLPRNIKKIITGRDFNQEINNLHEGLEEINLGNSFNQRIDNLPRSLKKIIILNNFNNSIDNLPLDLEELFFIGNFDQSLDFVPLNLIKITINGKFNKPIHNLLFLNKLKFIRLCGEFNQEIEHCLCDNVERIYLGSKFNKRISSGIPKNLKKIVFGKEFNHSIDELPDSVEEISLMGTEDVTPDQINVNTSYFQQKIHKLPTNLKYLFIHREYEHIESLKEIPNLEIKEYFSRDECYEMYYEGYICINKNNTSEPPFDETNRNYIRNYIDYHRI